MRPISLLFLALLVCLAGPKLLDGMTAGAATSAANQVLLPYANRNSTEATTAATSTATTTVATATRTSTPVPTTAGNTATATSTTVSGTATPTATPLGSTILNAWRINNSATSVALSGVLTEVQSITVTSVAGTAEIKMNSKSVPSYSQTMSSSVRATLTARPNYSTDFPSGILVGVGTPVNWGQNIGYSSTSCAAPTPGAGYWPRGPACASGQTTAAHFPLTPVAASTPTTTGGTVGYWVNGVAAFNWGDAQTYNNQGVWYRTAADWEKYDMDIDLGHATSSGTYHHHFYPVTLASQLGDAGTVHSPVYGFAADGYPIRGPWYANGVLAQSGWQMRDYDNASSATGCGTARKRTCLMVDQTNKNGGTTAASSSGPDTNATVSNPNGTTVLAVSGVFAQDYYYDATGCTVSAACLDQYNGHEHDGLGYHYHVTVTQGSDGSLNPRFPYIVGLKFKGTLPSNTFSRNGMAFGLPRPAAARP